MFIISKDYLVKNVIKYSEGKINDTIFQIEKFYSKIEIPKKRGTRTIYVIDQKSSLYQIQKNIQKNFLAQIKIPICAKGFYKETSYCDFLKEHVGKKYYMRMDIKEFFDSITVDQIYENLQDIVKSIDAIRLILGICTYHGGLPQGAVTSPMLSNLVFRRIDQRILKYCQKFDVTYTRYADDLLFSSNNIDFKNKKWFYKKIKYILQENGFKSNYSKRRMETEKLCLGGFVVEQEISLSRKKLNNINKILYYFKEKENSIKYIVDKNLVNLNCLEDINKLGIICNNGKERKFENMSQLINYLCGYRSFLIEIINSNDDSKSRKMKNLQNKINQIEKVVKQINLI